MRFRQQLWSLGLALIIALLHGGFYLLVMPPWQHYDEPAHFEYASNIARQGVQARNAELLPDLRREILESMALHRFYDPNPPPDLTGPELPLVGSDQRQHPVGYYLISAVPLWLVSENLAVESRLLMLRGLSLLGFLFVVACAWLCARELSPERSPLRWFLPLAVALTPPLADLMTAVNNDVAAITLVSLVTWLSLRLIRVGFQPRLLVALLISAGLAPLIKSTALIAVLFASLAIILALWLRVGGRLGVVGIGLAAFIGLAGVALFDREGAAAWYPAQRRNASIGAERSESPVGPWAGQLVVPVESAGQLTNPLLAEDVARVAGQEITVGGWFWSNHSVELLPVRLLVYRAGQPYYHEYFEFERARLTAEPQWYEWRTTLPADVIALTYEFRINNRTAQALNVYLDGASLVMASNPGQNLLRNGDFEQRGMQLRPAINQRIDRFLRLPITGVIASLNDLDRLGTYLTTVLVEELLFATFAVFGWAHIRLPYAPWLGIIQMMVGGGLGLMLVRLLGAWQRSSLAQSQWLLLVVVSIATWSVTWLRVLPALPPDYAVPVARYGFPAIISLWALIGWGWFLIPGGVGRWVARVLVGLLFVIAWMGGATVWAYYWARA